METIKNACTDGINQETVYIEEIFGSEIEINIQKLILDFTKLFDQHKAGDDMGCCVYGLTHDKHDTERIETLNPNLEWLKALENFGADKKKGWSLAGALNMYYKQGYIKGWSLVRGIDQMKKTIVDGILIYTGSSKISWVKTKARSDKMVVIVNSGPGHAFVLKGFDNNWKSDDGKYTGAFIAKNSNENFPEFFVPYELISCLFSTIRIETDETKARELREYNDKLMIEYAIKNGITNGSDLYGDCTRGQFAVMLWRLRFPGEEYDNALEFAAEDGIFSGKDPTNNITREQMMIMSGRVLSDSKISDEKAIQLCVDKGISNGSDKESIAKRKEAILMIGRIHKTIYKK